VDGVLYRAGEVPPPRRLPSEPVVWENQRYVLGWRAPSLPTDRHNFTNEAGTVQLAPPVAAPNGAPEAAWVVVGAGQEGGRDHLVAPQSPSRPQDPSPYLYEVVVEPGRTDAEGWSYALDFPREYSDSNWIGACVRRRMWRRVESGSAAQKPAAYFQHPIAPPPPM